MKSKYIFSFREILKELHYLTQFLR